jgi:hypothetical protein
MRNGKGEKYTRPLWRFRKRDREIKIPEVIAEVRNELLAKRKN